MGSVAVEDVETKYLRLQMTAPIALFTYCRLEHTRQTINALLRNPSAQEHDLIVFSDAARSSGDMDSVNKVRQYLETVTGFKSVTVNLRAVNYGLAKSIICGVTAVLEDYEDVIVLEDDMITSTHFLSYMTEALELFRHDERVVSIHGYNYDVEDEVPEAFFLVGADCWGWATWRRGWRIFNPNGAESLSELKARGLLREFDFNGTFGFSGMLQAQISGKNDSWAIRWYAAAFLANKLTLYPRRSLVHNIGGDGSGTHCHDDARYDSSLSNTPIDLSGIVVQPSVNARLAYERFFRKQKKSLVRNLFDAMRRAFWKYTKWL